MTSIFPSTPVEKYEINGQEIFVKREDLCCPEGSPRFSKIRGLELKLQSLQSEGVNTVAVLDSIHSKAGWGTAWLTAMMGMKCILYYPVRKGKPDFKSESVLNARRLGAEIRPMKAGRQTIMWYQVRKLLKEENPNIYLLPNGLTLDECAHATYLECFKTPDMFFGGTVVVSTSTGTIANGVANYLLRKHPESKMIAHMGYSRSPKTVRKIIGYHNLEIVDEGFQYADGVEQECPFPCNPHYDLKAWKWLHSIDLSKLKKPILFWNIGA